MCGHTTSPRGLLNKVLYGKAPPRGSNPYPLIYYFLPKWYTFHIPIKQNFTPFLDLKDKPKQ